VSVGRHHAEWLSLVETSGPFLSMPVLLRVFPQGLDSRDSQQAARLREAYEDWLDRGTKQPSVHRAWIRHVLHELLGYPVGWLAEGQVIPPGIQAVMANVGEVIRPDIVLQRDDAEGKPILLVALYSPEQDLEKPISGKLWKATAGTRMMELLHASDLPLGLVTNGEEWTLVSAPRGETTGFASWYADLWMQEPLTLRAFHSLLHLRRLVGVAELDTLPALFIESSKDQQEVTDQLGYQVRQAVEVLVQAFGRIDAESGRTLLSNVGEKALYDSALTVMMRLVFLFSVEERGLLLLGDPLYDQNYALSTLSALLREQADQHGEEVLERRHDAWCRLLSTFRAVHGGVEHEAMRLPPYGGTLFDPDRYPFLEGRPGDSSWRDAPAIPLLVNNRVVLHLLEALQLLRVRVPGGGLAEARRLSFRALDIEQIGHVYEGLLDHTAERAVEPVLGLAGSKDKEVEIPLVTLEEIARRGTVALAEFLRDETGRSERALMRLIEEPPTSDDHALLIACGQDERLARRVKPFAPFLREDSFGQLLVVLPGSVYVTAGSDRRSTGTHYTPRSLTEPIVRHTLAPLVYVGPFDGLPESEWTLKSPKDVLALKVCDMTMGSGAFLVETCRYLAERLVEAWENAEREHPGCFVVTPDGELSVGAPTERLIPLDAAERVLVARRYVADRCIYGVDINPMAVEMAKLSLWLVTLQRDRPFTFLDHALKCGDSLLGVGSLHHIENFSLRPGVRQITFGTADIARFADEASAKRQALEDIPSNDHGLIEAKNRLYAEAERATIRLKALADLLTSFELRGLDGDAYEAERTVAADNARHTMHVPVDDLQAVRTKVSSGRFFHWPLEFPEVFERGGFSAFVGNPPFYAGAWLDTLLGTDYRRLIVSHIAKGLTGVRGTADLCVYFLLRASSLIRRPGFLGFVATTTVAQGDSQTVGLKQLVATGAAIYRAIPKMTWPGTASLEVSNLWITIAPWKGEAVLADHPVQAISPSLDEQRGGAVRDPLPLQAFASRICKGSELQGDGFKVTEAEARRLIEIDPANADVLFPLMTGDDINKAVGCRPGSWVINFKHRSLEDSARFIEPFRLVEEKVKPERMGYTGDSGRDRFLRKFWWLFRGDRDDINDFAKSARLVVARSVVSKHPIFALLDSSFVFTASTYVFLFDQHGYFAQLQSTLHAVWSDEYGSDLSGRPRYLSDRCFKTYPLLPCSEPLERTGQAYHEARLSISSSRSVGLTEVYNRFHDRRDESDDIIRLRKLHVEMDRAVVGAYGWSDLDLDHGFYPTKQGDRHTVSESARAGILARLLLLNYERHADEAKASLTESRRRKRRSKSAASPASGQPDLLT
jgi:hypothetical protein